MDVFQNQLIDDVCLVDGDGVMLVVVVDVGVCSCS